MAESEAQQQQEEEEEGGEEEQEQEQQQEQQQQQQQRRRRDIFHRYFLQRLGLVLDEVEWPRPHTRDGDDGGGAPSPARWRARDPLTSLLGRERSAVLSKSGLTAAETALLAAEDAGEAGDGAGAQGAGAPSPFGTVPVASLVPPLPWCADGGAEDQDHVCQAFDAAAVAIARGHRRAALAAAAAAPVAKGAHDAASRRGDGYAPPLLRAMEAIRDARRAALDEASACEAVPPFLKKNNTIAWFHVPKEKNLRAGNGGTGAGEGSGAAAGAERKEGVGLASLAAAADTGGVTATSAATSVAGSTGSGGDKLSEQPRVCGSGSKSKATSSAKVAKRSHQEVSSPPASNEALKKKKQRALEKSDATKGNGSSSVPMHREGIKKEKKASFANKGDTTKPSTSSTSGANDTREAALCSLQRKFSSPLPPSANSNARPKRLSRISSAGSVTVEDIASLGGGANPIIARAVISAAAAGVFQEFHPKNDEDNRSVVTNDGVEVATAGDKDRGSLPETGLPNDMVQHKTEDAPMADGVIGQARRLGDRVRNQVRGAAWRGDQRREFRREAALSRLGGGAGACGGPAAATGEGGRTPRSTPPAHALPLVVPNPFVLAGAGGVPDKSAAEYSDGHRRQDRTSMLARGSALAPWKRHVGIGDAAWTESCLPRLLSVLRKGAGHAVLHDMQWDERSFRVADLLRHLAIFPCHQHWCNSKKNGSRDRNYGPHLIVTSGGEDFNKFVQVFAQLGHGLMPESAILSNGDRYDANIDPAIADNVLLRVLPYHGLRSCRRRLRQYFGSLVPPSPDTHFAFLAGLRDAPFHVILTTYEVLVEDYAHFCQIPFQAVVLDDGMSWLGCADADPHGKIGKVWNTGLWNGYDHGAGGAGVAGVAEEGGNGKISAWDFSKEVVDTDTVGRLGTSTSSGASVAASAAKTTTGGKHRLGLTARHRILLASNMHALYRGRMYKAPVLGLLSFLSPPFAEAIKDGCERSKISSCKKSMTYIRTILARLVVVYPDIDYTVGGRINAYNLVTLSVKSLNGELPLRALNKHTDNEDEGIDKLIKSQKIVQSRKAAASWFRLSSPIRKEFGNIPSFDSILDAVKKVHAMGFICEEVVTASCLTTSGAGGGVVGPSAYRAAVRCGRSFSSEQGLKLHIASAHAGARTWLCRSCGEDCGTNQARIQHEKTCGKLIKGSIQAPVSTETTKEAKGRKKKVVKNPIPKEDLDGMLGSGHKGVVKADRKTSGHSQGSENETPRSGISGTNPDLSVIDIKNLPPHVKPLLRDPNQTSRTGGNSKRYVYAYRGVCRQQRKGHDRWQSQISFNGTNHYLGTFDSEWDAAAVYAWAHLILYGEEATKEAQREGEEAAAAFAQQEKDIAEGKILAPSPPKPSAKKKKRNAPKKNLPNTDKGGKLLPNATEEESKAQMICKTNCPDDSVAAELVPAQSKKKRSMSLQEWSKLKAECAMMLSSGTKGTSKATILATRKDIAQMGERLLLHNISDYVTGHLSSVSKAFLQSRQQLSLTDVTSTQFVPPMLVGLQASDFAWEIESFIEDCQDLSFARDAIASFNKLFNEFGQSGTNQSFRTFLLSPSCILGRASKEPQDKLLASCHANSKAGMPAGNIDCNIGGPEYSCSEKAAKIQFLPSKYSNFQFMACNDDDIVTLNGQHISASMGPFPLLDMDVCSVGARVFVFVEEINF